MRTRALILVCAGLMACSGTGWSAPFGLARPGPPVTPLAESAHDTVRAEPRALKSPATATRISLLATIVPVVIGVPLGNSEGAVGTIGHLATASALYLGPATGYLYGDCGGRGLTGIAIRAGLTVVAAIALADAEWSFSGDSGDGNAAAGIAALAMTGIVIDAVYDLTQVSGTVRRANARRILEEPALMPVMCLPDPSGSPTVGLTLRF